MAKAKAELKKPAGRQVQNLKFLAKGGKDQPNPPWEDWAEKINALAEKEGYAYTITAEKLQKDTEGKPAKEKRATPLFAHQSNGEPTLTDLMLVKEMAGNKVEALAAEVARIADLASSVGGIERLNKCLVALEKLSA